MEIAMGSEPFIKLGHELLKQPARRSAPYCTIIPPLWQNELDFINEIN
jgi:hypothetical protein